MTQIANPFTDYESLEEAEAAAGFELSDPRGTARIRDGLLSRDGWTV